MPSLFSSKPSLKSDWHSLQRDLKSDFKDTLRQHEFPASKSQFHTFVRELEKSSNQKSGTKSKSRPMLPTEKGGKRLARVAVNEGSRYLSASSSPSLTTAPKPADRATEDEKPRRDDSKRGSLREREDFGTEKADSNTTTKKPRQQKNQRGHLREREWAREEEEAEAARERQRQQSAAALTSSRITTVESYPATPTSTVYTSVYEYPPSYQSAYDATTRQETGIASKI